jgi:hypothetical protein
LVLLPLGKFRILHFVELVLHAIALGLDPLDLVFELLRGGVVRIFLTLLEFLDLLIGQGELLLGLLCERVAGLRLLELLLGLSQLLLGFGDVLLFFLNGLLRVSLGFGDVLLLGLEIVLGVGLVVSIEYGLIGFPASRFEVVLLGCHVGLPFSLRVGDVLLLVLHFRAGVGHILASGAFGASNGDERQ